MAGATAGAFTETGNVGIFATSPTQSDKLHINGFLKGVLSACESCQVFYAYGDDQSNPDFKFMTLSDMSSKMFQKYSIDVAVGVGYDGKVVLDAASRSGILSVGVDTDYSLDVFSPDGKAIGQGGQVHNFTGNSSNYIISAVKRYDKALYKILHDNKLALFKAGESFIDSGYGAIEFTAPNEKIANLFDVKITKIEELSTGCRSFSQVKRREFLYDLYVKVRGGIVNIGVDRSTGDLAEQEESKSLVIQRPIL